MMPGANYVIYGCSSARTIPEVSLNRSFLTLEKNIIAVITQNKEIDDNLERQRGSEIDLSVQNWHEEFDKFWTEHLKISKICTLTGCFWSKYIMFELKKYKGVMFEALKADAKFEGKLTCAF